MFFRLCRHRFLIAISLIFLFLLSSSHYTLVRADEIRIGIIYTKAQWDLMSKGNDKLSKYRDAIVSNGGKIIDFAVGMDEKTINEKLKLVHGILIPGGKDVDPGFYGETWHEKLEEVDRELDELEFKILDYCNKNAIPVLGICRGHQVLNVFYGGTLYQDISSEYQGKKKLSHRDKTGEKYNDCYHEIIVEKDSLLYKIMGKDRLNVNTFHHQAVKKLGKGLKATAFSDDGIIEAIEAIPDKNTGEGESGPHCTFVLGVQFHPELMRIKAPEFNAIFKAFIKEAGKKI